MRQQTDHISTLSQWEMVYASLALILVALFAMLVAYSQSDADRMAVLKSGFEPETSIERVLIPQAMEDMLRISRRQGLEGEVQLSRIPNGFKAVIQSQILFESAQASIRPDLRPYLDSIGAMAKKWDFTVEVQGHTDSIPIQTAEFASNWELSTARAVNVLRYFLEEIGLEARRLSAVGFGPYQTVADNVSADGRAANRRIEILFGLDRKGDVSDTMGRTDG